MANPQNLKVGWQQIQSIYGQNSWNGFETAGGWHIGPATGLINFYASNYNVSYSTQQTIQQLNAKKLELTQQRDAAIAQMQAASDQSAVQKQQAIITALNGAIADVNGSIAQAIQTANLQIGKTNKRRRSAKTSPPSDRPQGPSKCGSRRDVAADWRRASTIIGDNRARNQRKNDR